MHGPLATFPPEAGDTATLVPAALRDRGLNLRTVVDADLPWLRQLYRDLRAEELAPLQWPTAAQSAFADNQFALQHAHYLAHYRAADFLLIEQRGEPVGRYYLLRQTADCPDDYLIVDISLCTKRRGQGIGRALIAQTQQQAAGRGAGVRLHVRHDNTRAQQLYARLGFAATGDRGVDLAMRWCATR
ncbi:MAG: GNAT family N-acetyltransferase [Lysobacter sp.]